MGATTFMMYQRERARNARMKAKRAKAKAAKAELAEKEAFEKEAAEQEARAKMLKAESEKFNPDGKAKTNEPEEVTDDKVHFQAETKETQIDLDGDGKPDISVRPVS